MIENLKKKSSWQRCVLLYTLIFVVLLSIILVWFAADGRILVEALGDGTRQRLRAMYFYSSYLKQIVATLIREHRLVIPNWDFSIGQGADIVGTLQYFAEIGDPIASLCFFVPQRFLALFYSIVPIARLYLAGISFIALLRYKGYFNNLAVLSGAYAYIFCNMSFDNIPRYPHYLIPLVYFPLVILGVEMVIDKKRPYLLSLVVTFCSMSNFYYFYLTVFFTVIYVAGRLIYKYKRDIRSILADVLKIGVFSGIGVLLGAVIVFPNLYAFTHDARTSVDYLVHAFYPIKYYSGLPGKLISYGDCDISFGGSVFGFVAIVMLFVKKGENILLRVCAIAFVVMASFPIFGSIMNGFSYSINRWGWAFALLEGFLIVYMWDDLVNITVKQSAIMMSVLLCYAMLCVMLEYSRSWNVMVAIILAIAGIFMVSFGHFAGSNDSMGVNRPAFIQLGLLALVCISVVSNGFYKNDLFQLGYVKAGTERKLIGENFLNNETSAIKQAASELSDDATLYRYSGQALAYNAGITADLSSTVYYWSISNPYIVKFRELMGINDYYIFRYTDNDNRTILNTLEGVKYYAVNESSDVLPYGYTFVGSYDVRNDVENAYIQRLERELGSDELSDRQKYDIRIALREVFDVYTNDNTLPLLYTYDSCISEEEFEGLSLLNKQEALLQSAVVGSDESGVNVRHGKPIFAAEQVPYTFEADEELTVFEDGRIVTTAPDQKLTLYFNGLPDSETYLVVKGFDFKETTEYELYQDDISLDPQNLYNKTNWDILRAQDRDQIKRNHIFRDPVEEIYIDMETSEGKNKRFCYHTAEFDHYTGRHDYALNLDYSKEPLSSVTLSLPRPGVYSFSDISVQCLPFAGYEDRVKALKSDKAEYVLDKDELSGTITVENDKLMCIALPYSKGWSAYVDDHEVDIINTNIEYMGVELSKGEHTFRLKYHTPLLKLGMIVSLLTLIMAFVAMLIYEKGYVTKISRDK